MVRKGVTYLVKSVFENGFKGGYEMIREEVTYPVKIVFGNAFKGGNEMAREDNWPFKIPIFGSSKLG